MKIKMTLSPDSIDAAIKKLEDYKNDLDRKAREICERLALIGALYAEWNFSGVLYAGDIDYNITVEQKSANCYSRCRSILKTIANNSLKSCLRTKILRF